MQTRAFGPGAVAVPVLGQGTWNMELDDPARAIDALQKGFSLDMNHVDTAEMYGRGRVEELVARAIQGRRDRVFLVSKVLPENASRKKTIAACEGSLKRLKTDRLDCYLLHWRGEHPLQETFEAFERLEREGKILSFGVSNFDVSDLEEAEAIVGPKRIACNQVLYHLGQRGIEHAVIPWCEKHGVAVVAYSPFGAGRFPPRGSTNVLDEIARRNSATPRQVALAFLTRNMNVFAIPKASDAGHVADNAGADRLRLSAAEVGELDAAFPLGPAPRELPTL